MCDSRRPLNGADSATIEEQAAAQGIGPYRAGALDMDLPAAEAAAFEDALGHLQRHRIRNGTVIRFHRYQAAPVHRIAGVEVGTRRDLAEAIAGVVILLALFIGIPWLMYLVAGTP
jgi:hypothetical protein